MNTRTLAAATAFAIALCATGALAQPTAPTNIGVIDPAAVQPAESEDDGLDLGWLGLIGLAGLVGLRRKREVPHDTDIGAAGLNH